MIEVKRPVYLYWSEDRESRPQVVGWGGGDLYRCEVCPEWQGEEDGEAERHSLLHEKAKTVSS